MSHFAHCSHTSSQNSPQVQYMGVSVVLFTGAGRPIRFYHQEHRVWDSSQGRPEASIFVCTSLQALYFHEPLLVPVFVPMCVQVHKHVYVEVRDQYEIFPQLCFTLIIVSVHVYGLYVCVCVCTSKGVYGVSRCVYTHASKCV